MEQNKKKSVVYYFTAFLIVLCFFSLSFFSTAGMDFTQDPLSGDSLTADELPHIASGYYYLTSGRNFLNPEHPPLVKNIAAIPLLLLDLNLPDFSQEPEKTIASPTPMPLDQEVENNQMQWARKFIFQSGNDADKIAWVARCSVAITNSLLLFLLFVLIAKLLNPRTGLIMLGLITFSPFLLAHASLVTMDTMSGLLQMLTLAGFALYLKNNVNKLKFDRYFWLTLVFLTLANLAKFSSLLLLPALFAGALIYFTAQNNLRQAIKLATCTLIALTTGMLLIVSCVYALQTRHTTPAELMLQVNRYYLEELPASGIYLLQKLAFLHPLGKGLAQYTVGLFMVFWRLTRSHQITYFLGQVYGSEGCGFWYFPVLYLTKLPLGFLALNLAPLVVALRSLAKRRKIVAPLVNRLLDKPFYILLFTFAYLYLTMSLQSTLNIGLRHIIPVILAIAILCSAGITRLWSYHLLARIRLRECFIVCAGLLIFTTLRSAPHFLSYYNPLGGGTDQGYQIATDSNYDWGQDVKRLVAWVEDNSVPNIYSSLFTNVDLEYYLGSRVIYYDIKKSPPLKSGDYLAISTFELQNSIHASDPSPATDLEILPKKLVQRIGKTIFVYRIV